MDYRVIFWKIAVLTGRFVRILWVFACVLLLLAFFDVSDPLLAIPMLILSFPSGLSGFALYAILDGILTLFFPSVLTNDTFMDWNFPIAWSLIFAAGYWQWFILVPRWVDRLKNKQVEPTRDVIKIPSLDIRIMWVGASMMVLGFTIYGIDRSIDENELGKLLALLLERSMLMLSFPMGYICTFISAVLLSLFNVEIESLNDSAYVATVSYSRLISAFSAYWVSFLVVGYLQWFVVVPHLVAKVPFLAAKFEKEW